MAAINKNNLTANIICNNIAERTIYAIDTVLSHGYSIKKIELVFTLLPSFKQDNKLLCNVRTTDIYSYPSTIDKGTGIDAIHNFMRRTSLGYSQMIENVRHQQYEYLELTCAVEVIGEKKAPDSKISEKKLSGKIAMDGNLATPFWDSAFGDIPPLMKAEV